MGKHDIHAVMDKLKDRELFPEHNQRAKEILSSIKMKKRVVVLTGAGVSAQSGVKTFRDHDGLWEGHDVETVAHIDSWREGKDNKELMLKFYNQRRKQLAEVLPNGAHDALKDLETDFEVYIITQNVDDLHERAGSSNVLHLHGELSKACSSNNKNLTVEYPVDGLKLGDKHEDGSQLRPFIVWFGEGVPMFDEAVKIVKTADILVVIGTSLVVYPAASLINYCPMAEEIYVIDPSIPHIDSFLHCPLTLIEKDAVSGMNELKELLAKRYLDGKG